MSSSPRLAKTTLQYLASLSYRTGELQTYLDDIARGVSELMAMDWSVVTLYMGEFDRILASSLELGEASDQLYPLHGTVTQTVVKSGCPLTVMDVQRTPEYGQTPDGYRAYLGVPLRSPNGNVLGTICSFNQQPRAFENEDVKVVELFAERAAIAIDNFQLYQQQQQFNQALEAEVAKRTVELKATQAQLVEQERLAAIGEFTSMIVHEIRNPLTTIEMGLSALQRLDLCDRDRLRLRLALEEEERLKKLLNEILLYAKPQILDRTVLSLKALIQETLSTLSNLPVIQSRQLVCSPIPMEINVMGDRDKLKQVLINLFINACEAVKAGDKVSIQVNQTPSVSLDNPSTVSLQVHNGGEPIPADLLPRLTQPFFSTKSSGNGLGLAIVKRILEAHGGILDIDSSKEAGTTITLRLPIAPER